VQAAINGASALSSAGVSVSVTQTAGVLNLTSTRYGSASSVSVGGSGALDLLGAAPVSTAGLDVAGSVDGVAGTGSGQTLTAGAGTAARGLAVDVSGGSLRARGTVSFSRGIAARLSGVLDDILSAHGLLASSTDGINRSIKDLDAQRTAMTSRLTSIEARYRAQFTQLDTLLASMQSTSTFLTQQLGVLNGSNVSSKSK
jgi:flagellar hook-associated protein 2